MLIIVSILLLLFVIIAALTPFILRCVSEWQDRRRRLHHMSGDETPMRPRHVNVLLEVLAKANRTEQMRLRKLGIDVRHLDPSELALETQPMLATIPRHGASRR
jgi:hypothetical protein